MTTPDTTPWARAARLVRLVRLAGCGLGLTWGLVASAPAWAEAPVAASAAASVAAGAAPAPAAVPEGSIKATPFYQDPALLAQAWALPVASRYKAHIEFQHNGSFCGPTSVANVWHSWGRPGDQASVLDGTGVRTLLGFLPLGLTLDELAAVVRQKMPGKQVTVMRGLDLAAFRAQLRLSNDPGRRYIVNFSRAPLFGSGGGHHSPIAGYLAAQDLVLVLDVNQDFGPWLVRADRLWAAMNTPDSTAGQWRGLMLIQ